MTVNILIISQTNIGKSILKAAHITYKTLPIDVTTYCVEDNDDPEAVLQTLNVQVEKMDVGDGILILTDLYGSTPSNIAHEVEKISQVNVRVVAGINLPMLIKVLNYPQSSLDTLAKKAIEGGKQGICSQHDCEKQSYGEC